MVVLTLDSPHLHILKEACFIFWLAFVTWAWAKLASLTDEAHIFEDAPFWENKVSLKVIHNIAKERENGMNSWKREQRSKNLQYIKNGMDKLFPVSSWKPTVKCYGVRVSTAYKQTEELM